MDCQLKARGVGVRVEVAGGVRTVAVEGAGGGFRAGVELSASAGSVAAAGAPGRALADVITLSRNFIYLALLALGQLQQCIIVCACLLCLEDRLSLMVYPFNSPSAPPSIPPSMPAPINWDSSRNQSIIAFHASFNCDSNSKIPYTQGAGQGRG